MTVYKAEYENVYGETWVFEYDYSTNTATLKGSDVNWQSYPVKNGNVTGLIFTKDEQAWLRSTFALAVRLHN